MVKVVIDSSVVIDYTRAGLGVLPHLLSLRKSKKMEIYMPASVFLELWAGESMADTSEEVKVERLLIPVKTANLTKQIAKMAGELIRLGMVKGVMDSAIAATTLYLDAQLATQNKKHFSKVPNLRFFIS